MASTQIKRIEKLIAQIADSQTIAQKKKFFQSINRTLTRVINRIDRERLEIEKIANDEHKYDNAVSESKNENYKIAKREDLAKSRARKKQARERLKQTLIIGYELLMTIREGITKEGFLYDIMVQTSSNTFSSILIDLKFKDLINMTNLEDVSGGRYQVRFKDLSNLITNNENVINYQYFVESSPSTAFSAFYRFFTDERLHAQYKLNNFGTFYEAYSRWYYAYGNNQIPSNEQILECFQYAKSGGGTSGAFYKGGDNFLQDLNISNKAQSLSAAGNPGRPSLTNLSAIKNGLQNVRNSINIFIETGEIEKIEQVFASSRLGETVQQGAVQTGTEILVKELTNK